MVTDDKPAHPVHVDIDGLDAAIRSATPGPWQIKEVPWKTDKGGDCVELHIETAWIHGQLKDRAAIIGRSLHCTNDESNKHGVWLMREDANLIVAAVNALPDLITIAESAAGLVEHAPPGHPLHSCGGPQEACMQPGCTECGCPTMEQALAMRAERDALKATAAGALNALKREWPQHALWRAQSPEADPIRRLAAAVGVELAP